MNYRKAACTGFLIAALSACVTPPVKLDHIPLVWKPTSEMKTLPVGTLDNIMNTKLQFDSFKDVRKQPELIAENREDATPKSVTTRDDVGDFVSSHVREAFDREGLKTVASGGDVVISGEVRQFFVDETTVYKGDVVLQVSVRSRSGKSLWTGAATGSATRFGHSYRAENYYEVFSDSLLDAVSSLLQDKSFCAALATKE